MRKIFAFLTEPASYTVDRNVNVFVHKRIDYCYINSKSEAKSIISVEGVKDILSEMTLYQKIRYIQNVLRTYDKVIYNGYANFCFLIVFLLNYWYRKPIGIESDTQYSEPSNVFVRLIKRIYLKIVFGNKYIYGLAGGSCSHKDLFRKYGMQEKRILLLPMMVNNLRFDDPAFVFKKTNPFRFVYVGRLIECKNVEFMIRAFLKFHKKCTCSELHIVGNGVLENSLRQRYVACEGIYFHGAKYGGDLLDMYRDTNVLILPSVQESWGLVVNEAMCAGLPVLVSEEVGARYDLVDGHETGLVFKSNDEQNLVNAMEKISQETVYKQYSVNAYKRMHEFWNYDLYEKCLNDFLSIHN